MTGGGGGNRALSRPARTTPALLKDPLPYQGRGHSLPGIQQALSTFCAVSKQMGPWVSQLLSERVDGMAAKAHWVLKPFNLSDEGAKALAVCGQRMLGQQRSPSATGQPCGHATCPRHPHGSRPGLPSPQNTPASQVVPAPCTEEPLSPREAEGPAQEAGQELTSLHRTVTAASLPGTRTCFKGGETDCVM